VATRGVRIMLTTHDLEFARIAERALVGEDRRIACDAASATWRRNAGIRPRPQLFGKVAPTRGWLHVVPTGVKLGFTPSS